MSDWTDKKAWLATEDGLFLEGRSVGAEGQSAGVLACNTDMVGYQELVTDPRYQGNILTFTMTQIGNYGVNAEDVTSAELTPNGVIVREMCFKPSNWRSEGSFPDYLRHHGIIAIDSIDTRMIVHHVRDSSKPLMAVISTTCGDKDALVAAAQAEQYIRKEEMTA